MSDLAARDVEDPGTPTHRARPSIMTTASGLAESTMTFGSLMSSDGLARLSQFPPPPSGIPFTPIESAFAGPSSPVTSDRSMTPPAGPRRTLPAPPLPLNVQKKSFPSSSPSDAQSPSGFPDSQPPPSVAPSSGSLYPSPHDWHDGSSSIANDPYGDAILSTSLITSLLSSVSGADDNSTRTAGPSSYNRNNYEPSVVSNALTTDSTITYPPPKTFPPPLPTNHKYPPLSRPLPSPKIPDHIIDISSPQVLNPPSHSFRSLGGRKSPETWVSEGSSQVPQMAGPEPPRAMSVTPSLQSMTSSTPLISTFAKGDPILEEDEARISGPSTPSQSRYSRTRERRASTAHSTKTTKSYVSSLMSRISHSTGAGDRRSLKQVATWFRGKPLPPVPPLPDHTFREIRKAEDELPLPDLVTRAAVLSSLLDKGHRPYHSTISLENVKEQTIPQAGGYGDVRFTGADPTRVNTARGMKGRSGDFSQQPWSRALPPDPDTPIKSTRFLLTKKRKLIIGISLVALVICIVVGVAVGVTVGEKHSSRHSCPGNQTGAACTLGRTTIHLSVYVLSTSM